MTPAIEAADVRRQLTDALDRAEGRARALLAEAQRTSLTLRERRLLGREIPGWHAWPEIEAMCGRELRLVERDRRDFADILQALDGDRAVHVQAFWLAGRAHERMAAFWLATPELDHG